jgi:hypothetical protein
MALEATHMWVPRRTTLQVEGLEERSVLSTASLVGSSLIDGTRRGPGQRQQECDRKHERALRTGVAEIRWQIRGDGVEGKAPKGQ